jgi:hypothetical protein
MIKVRQARPERAWVRTLSLRKHSCDHVQLLYPRGFCHDHFPITEGLSPALQEIRIGALDPGTARKLRPNPCHREFVSHPPCCLRLLSTEASSSSVGVGGLCILMQWYDRSKCFIVSYSGYAICATRICTLEWYRNGRRDDKWNLVSLSQIWSYGENVVDWESLR